MFLSTPWSYFISLVNNLKDTAHCDLCNGMQTLMCTVICYEGASVCSCIDGVGRGCVCWIFQPALTQHTHPQVQTKHCMAQYGNLANYWACTENSRLWPWTEPEDNSASKNHDIIPVPECRSGRGQEMATDYHSTLRRHWAQQNWIRAAFQMSLPLLSECCLLDCGNDVGHFRRRRTRPF